MRTKLLPAADELTEVNQAELDKGYNNERSSGTWAAGRVVLTALALLGVLGGLQYFLFRRFRRVFNPPLLAATVVVLAFLIWTLTAFHTVTVNLKGAKEDAFDSIGVLERAQADAYDANGDESRWLLEYRTPQQANFYEKAFNQKADRVATRPAGLSDEAFLQEIKQLTNKVPGGFEGYLAAELKNITFLGERTRLWKPCARSWSIERSTAKSGNWKRMASTPRRWPCASAQKKDNQTGYLSNS